VLGVIVVAFGLVFLLPNSKPERNWYESLHPSSKHPYGTYMLYELFNNLQEGEKLPEIQKRLSRHFAQSDSAQQQTYFFLGHNLYLDSLDADALLDFIAAGNNALIISKSIPGYFFEKLSQDSCGKWYESDFLYDRDIRLNLVHSDLKMDEDLTINYVVDDTVKYDENWHVFGNYTFCENQSPFQKLGSLEDLYSNFIAIEYGSGKAFLHTTPLAFTNHYLMQKEGLDYANRCLSHIQHDNIVWDRYSTDSNFNFDGQNSRLGTSPLSYILSQPPLYWALYTILGMVLLFLFFQAKREQRIIPVIEPNENSSLEFVNTLGRLYYLQNDQKKLCLQIMKLFKAFVRNRYRITIQEDTDKWQKELQLKSQIPQDHIQTILEKYKAIDYLNEVSEEMMIEFYQAIEYFYKNCK